MTCTYVTLELSAEAYDEIASKLVAAEYDHAFIKRGVLDMHGIAVTRGKKRNNPGDAITRSRSDPLHTKIDAQGRDGCKATVSTLVGGMQVTPSDLVERFEIQQALLNIDRHLRS